MKQQAHLNLYRKYRPSSFSQLSGQEHISNTIQAAVYSGRLSHAYMFSGPRGTGKTSAARLMAKVLNCLEPLEAEKKVDCCGKCINCRHIEEMNFMDLIEIDAASNNSVDDIRSMREKVKYRPVEGKYKVYIIDEVHMLSGSAFNAFLKTLEEPPENVIFILATTDPQKVPATIMSRCQCFDFHAVAHKTIQSRLQEIVEIESAQGNFPAFDSQALSVIAESAQGGFRDALSLLDQIAASSFDNAITDEQVLLMIRKLGFSTLSKISQAIFQKDASTVIRELNQLYNSGYEPFTIARDLLEYFRRCMLFKIDLDANQILELPVEQAESIKNQVADLSIKYILSSLTRIERSLATLKNSFQSRILFEADLIKLSLGEELYSTDQLEKRIEQLEHKLAILRRNSVASAAVSAPTGARRRYEKPAPENKQYVVSEPSAVVKDPTLDFRNAVASKSNICQALLVSASIGKPDNGILPVKVTQAFAAEKLREDKNISILLQAAKEALSKSITGVKVGTDKDFAAGSAAKAEKIDHQKEIKKIDEQVYKKTLSKPAIADAVEVFGGEIVDIE